MCIRFENCEKCNDVILDGESKCEKCIAFEEQQKLEYRANCLKCGKEIELGSVGYTDYCSLKCSNTH